MADQMTGQMTGKFMFPWESMAKAGDPMPDGFSLADKMAYTALRNIYRAYEFKTIPRDVAAAEKRSLRTAWEQAKQREAMQDKLALHHIKIIRGTNVLNAQCRKDPSPENAIRLCNALDGMGLTDFV